MNYVVLPANLQEQRRRGEPENLEEKLSSPVTIQVSDLPFRGYVSANMPLSLYAISPFILLVKGVEGSIDTIQIKCGSTVVIAQQAKFRIQGPAQIHFTTLANELFILTRHPSVV